MERLTPTDEEKAVIDPLLQCFDENLQYLERSHETLLRTINTCPELKPLIHSIRARVKNRSHLEDKLVRMKRKLEQKGEVFDVVPANLHTKVNDLAGIRILHLHTLQAKEIHQHLHRLLMETGYQFLEGPEARTWDIEYEATFTKMGFTTKRSETMYTSVHYVIFDKIPKLEMTCELQVRTLTEETWGEIDHTINYPHATTSVPLHEQIRALARATSAAGRLADAIFATLHSENERKKDGQT